MNQQDQTLAYFKGAADAWQSDAINKEYSLVENRHNAVMSVIHDAKNIKTLLDVGCGTGQLVLQTAKLGISSQWH